MFTLELSVATMLKEHVNIDEMIDDVLVGMEDVDWEHKRLSKERTEAPAPPTYRFGLLITDELRFLDNLDGKVSAKNEFQLVYIGDTNNLGKNIIYADEVWQRDLDLSIYRELFKKSLERLKYLWRGRFYEDAYTTTIDVLPEIAWVKGRNGKYLSVNDTFSRLSGKFKDDIIDRDYKDVWEIDAREEANDYYNYGEHEDDVISAGGVKKYEEMIKTTDGVRQFSVSRTPLYNSFGYPWGTVGVGHDISDFTGSGVELSILIENMPLPLIICDSDYGVIQMNTSFKDLTKLDTIELARLNYLEWKRDHLIPATAKIINEKSTPPRQDFKMRDGLVMRYYALIEQEILDHANNLSGYYIVFLDLTTQKMYEKAILQEANSDSLTGLHNRKYFYDYIKQQWGTPMTLLYMDLDHFKEINDTYGHARGDDILRDTATLITEVYSEGVVCRLGGDEFTVILQGKQDPEIMSRKAKKLQDGVRNLLRKNSIPISVSIGEIYTDGTRKDLDRFVQDADKRMYTAKAQKKKLEAENALKLAEGEDDGKDGLAQSEETPVIEETDERFKDVDIRR